MKFKLDENLPLALAELLRSKGLDAHTAAEEGLAGSPDARILNAAHGEGRVLMTFDTDFADVRAYPPAGHTGIVVFRLQDQRWNALEAQVLALLSTGRMESLAGCLVVVDENKVRIRR